MKAPKLRVGDRALGCWGALEDVFPETRHQRCWAHKSANILNYLPRAAQPKAKSMLHEMWMAETRAEAERAFERFLAVYSAKYPKAAECLAKDTNSLLAFYDFLTEHWLHVRTTNPIESSFATIRHRTERTRGWASRATLLGLVFKLAMSAEKNWRRLRGLQYLADVVRGVKFVDGVKQQKQNQTKPRFQQVAT